MIDALISQFSAESFSEWCREKFDRFTADIHDATDAGDFSKAEIVGYVQSLPDDDTNRPLLVMAVHAGEQIGERSSRRRQFDFARKQLQAAIDKPPAKVKGLFTQGLFAFYDSTGNFRLSLISGRAEGRKLVYSDFKRQSFFVKPDRNNKTFRNRMAPAFGTYEDLAAAFSVETLTKEFYNSLFAWYERAMDKKSNVTFPNDLARDDDDRDLLAEHLIRLITRLMFVWFIRQKDLVPEKLFAPEELKVLLKGFDPKSSNQDNYYRAVLQNLFFATLNCEIKDREFAAEGAKSEDKVKEHYGIKMLYRYRDEFACPPEDVIRLFRSVPFLNGGLFECLDKKRDDSARSPVMYHDGFSREPKKRAHIPNRLFFDEHGLITLFAHYDFTVDENSPNDTDVALDPELLGKVFENLLGAFNPETKETARKQSGSFYTPREIVNYMVDESLKAHLTTNVGQAFLPATTQTGMSAPHSNAQLIATLFDPEAAELPFTESQRRALVQAIYHCRILDPACGSGAFPMGLLLKMVHLLQRLDPKNTLWHEVVMAETEKALAEAETLNAAEKRQRRQRITDSFDQNVNQPDYARKLYLIENCIFGVDIQPIAVQIAKLRAFITLVCDQEPDPKDVAGNYGMLPLPNLETKFVAANSLIGLSADFADGLKPADGGTHLDDPTLVKLRAELAEIRHQHFRARTASDKNACRKQDRELRGKIKLRLVEIASKPDEAKIAHFQAEIAAFQRKRETVADEKWADVVQTKPTQTDLFQTAPAAVQTVMRIEVDVNKEKRDQLDDEIYRLNRAIETEKNRAKNKSAFQKEADSLAAWDPYDQNAASPFFDPQWMFDVRGGFDVVIGNPPYIPIESMTEKDKAAYEIRFPMLSRKYDSSVVFILVGLDLLSKRGVLSFISSITWQTGENYSGVRRRLFTEVGVRKLVNLPFDVFKAAYVDTGVYVISREPSSSYLLHRFPKTVISFALANLCFESIPTELVQAPDFKVILDLRTNRLLQKAKAKGLSVELGNISESTQGLAGSMFRHTRSQKAPEVFPFVETGQVYRYILDVTRTFQTDLSEKPSLKRFYDAGEKILIRRVINREDRLMATTTSERLVFKKDVNPFLITDPLYLPKYVLGILNSKFISYLYINTSSIATKDDFRQTTLAELRRLPIAIPAEDIQTKVVSLVERILGDKKKNSATDTKALESELDELVYALYRLTDDEIAIVEGRDAGAKRTPVAAKQAKAPTARQPKKSVLTDDPELG